MLMQNKSSHLLQSQLTELIDSHSRSSELVRIMNKFGVGMSRDTMSHDMVKAILNNLSDEKIRSELNSNHDSFKVATGDNTDRNIKSGKIVFGKKKSKRTCMPPPFSQLHLVQTFTKILHQTTAHL